jgi:hypothetical protein
MIVMKDLLSLGRTLESFSPSERNTVDVKGLGYNYLCMFTMMLACEPSDVSRNV